MNLTFRGFLKAYCRELSGQDSLSLRKLALMALGDCPRLAEPLFALAATQSKSDYMQMLVRETPLEEAYGLYAKGVQDAGSIEQYVSDKDAPLRMKKVWNAYLAKKHAVEPQRRIVSLMRPAIKNALEERSMTIYRLCKELNLNPGNVYAYLNGGDHTKVSKATASRILEYLAA